MPGSFVLLTDRAGQLLSQEGWGCGQGFVLSVTRKQLSFIWITCLSTEHVCAAQP